MTRPLLAVAAFLCLTATADARVFISVDTAKSVTGGKMLTEHLALSAKGVPNTGTVDASCVRQRSTVVVCRYTIEKHPRDAADSVCKRKVTVTRKNLHHPATGKVHKYACEAPTVPAPSPTPAS